MKSEEHRQALLEAGTSPKSLDNVLYALEGPKASLKITQSKLIVDEKGKGTVYFVKDCVGASSVDNQLSFFIYYSPPASCCSAKDALVRKVVMVEGHEREQVVGAVNVIIRLSQNMEALPVASKMRNFWVFINPVSGTRKALSVWEDAKQVFSDASIECDVQVTSRAFDCRDSIINKEDIMQYDCILTVGGDGLLLEAVNGIMQRKDWKEVVQNIALFPLPGGTGNGLAKSLHHSGNTPLSPKHGAFICAKNGSKRMDIGVFQNEDKGLGYSFLEIMWGIPADVDIESEVCRCFGSARMDVYGLMRICCLRKYKGNFSYLPSTEGESIDYYWDLETSKTNSTNNPILSLLPSSIDAPLPSNWVTVEGDNDWIMIWAMNVTHASGKDLVAPSAVVDDGYFHIVILRNVGRCSLLDMFLKLEEGKHVDNPAVQVIKSRAFRLEPQRLRHARGGILDVDGEEISYGKVQLEVLRGFLKTYVPLDF